MKKISKLNDVAFHLINKVNKKKLKINTLLIKNWEKIFGINHHFVQVKKITLLGQEDSLNLELKDVNNQQLNDIKDEEVRSIFKNISSKINE